MMRINLKQYRVLILLLISCIAVMMPSETLARPNVRNTKTITLYSLLPTKRTSHLNSFSWKSNVGNVGIVYLGSSGNVWLSFHGFSLNTVTFSDLENAWGKASAAKANAKEDYSTYKLKGIPSNGSKPGIYFVDVIFVDNKLYEYRIRRDGVFDSSWIKANAKGPQCIIKLNRK